MPKIITRFAPSPTGMLHVGNARTAIVNWLYTKKNNGKFILRLDDTDLERSRQEYKDAIEYDLRWLGLEWDATFTQSGRLGRYEEVKNILLAQGHLYPCFETIEELEIKRKFQLSAGLPPIYDRASLKLSKIQVQNYLSQGKKPHYRFLINDSVIHWDDMIKGNIRYEGNCLSDPIVIREDGSMTYMLCSVTDDIDYQISHVIRGEDHITNTAIQTQMFAALNSPPPAFGHLSLVKARDEKISKRAGGFELATLRETENLDPMTINSFFSLTGSSKPVLPYKTLASLVEDFDITAFSKSPTIYLPEELERLNHKLVISYSYLEVKNQLQKMEITGMDEQFWLIVRPNLQKLSDVKTWWEICHSPARVKGLDWEFLRQAANLFPEGNINIDTWNQWTKDLATVTGRKGKELFLPIRLALTGMDHGPEMKSILLLLSKEEILHRLHQ